MNALEVRAPAKINLFLRVLAREETGYHQIETLFCGIDLADRIRVELLTEPGVELRVRGPWELGPPVRNLAVRAARGFLSRIDAPGTGARLELEKEIPPGSGLGGGSSDAAAVLGALNRLSGEPLGEEDLLRIGGALGSDVPFFLGPSPLALAWGRGERIFPLPPLPSRPLLVVSPPFGVSTAEAYEALARDREEEAWAPRARIFAPGETSRWEDVVARAENAFETVVFGRRPELAAARRALRSASAAPSLLCGSGSSLFGLFTGDEERAGARAVVEEGRGGWSIREARTLEHWP